MIKLLVLTVDQVRFLMIKQGSHDLHLGNMVIDGLMQHLFNKPYDDGGKHVKCS